MLQDYTMLFEVMQELGKRWMVPTLLIVLFNEKTTFSKIKKQLRITSRTLSKNLKILENMGFIERIFIDNSRKAYYTLSESGAEITKRILSFKADISR